VIGNELENECERMVIMPKEKTKFIDCKSRLSMESILLASLPAADRAAVISQ
jgi:hypothetical protein